MRILRTTLDAERQAGKAAGASTLRSIAFGVGWLAAWESDSGNAAAARAALAEHARLAEASYRPLTPDSFIRFYWPQWTARFATMVAQGAGDHATMRDRANETIRILKDLKAAGPAQEQLRDEAFGLAYTLLAEAHVHLKEPGAAEGAAREAVRHFERIPARSGWDELDRAAAHTFLAIGLARQGRTAQAQQALEPALAVHRKHSRTEDATRLVQMAQAHYAAALAGHPQAGRLLDEADRALDRLPAEFGRLRTVAQARSWVAEEQRRARR
jgi:tetratricopeptide (TPR) repeat protein